MIEIKFNHPRYNFSKYFSGPIFLLLGISYVINEQVLQWNHYAYLFLGVCTTLLLIFDKQKNYLIIGDEKLVINKLWPSTVYLKDVIGYQINEGQLKICTNNAEVTVELSLVAETSKTALISFLEKLKPITVNH